MDDFIQSIRVGGLAALFTAAAGVSLILLSNVEVIAQSDQVALYPIAGAIVLGSAVGPLVPQRLPSQPAWELLLWNGAGWSIGLTLLGLETVGAMPLWSIMLIALALTFWPRDPERRLPPALIAFSLLGGFLVCWLAWSQPNIPGLDTWLEGI